MELKDMESLLDKQATEIKKSYSEKIGEIDTDIKNQLKQIEGQYKDGQKATEEQIESLKKATEDYTSKYDEMQKHLDALDIRLKKSSAGTVENKKSFAETLKKSLEENKGYLESKMLGKSNLDLNIEMNTKAVGDMASASNLTGSYFVMPQVQPGVIGIPSEPNRIRQYLPTGSTSSNVIRHIRYTGKEGGPAPTAEGALKPQMDMDFQIYDTNVRKIAAYVRFPEEMATDIPFLTSFLTTQGLVELSLIEDSQLYSGDGTGENLSGLTTNATAFAAGGLTDFTTGATQITALRAAMNQVRLSYYNPTAIMLHPTDVTKIKELRASDGQYIVRETLNNPVPSLDGIPIVQNTNVTEGEFMVGNFGLAVQLFDRMSSNIRLYDQDRDNPIRNMITAVIEQRLALVTYRPQAMVYGTFIAAIANLDSGVTNV